MGDFLTSSRSFKLEQSDWLSSFRENASTIWENYSLPTLKTEDWKYTSLAALNKASYFDGEPLDSSAKIPEVLPELNGSVLVFINGHFSQAHSVMPSQSGVTLTNFDSADESQQVQIGENLGQLIDAEKHGFAALNSKCINDGVFVSVAKNIQVEAPIYVLHLVDARAEAAVNARVLVQLEAGAQAELVEHFVSSDGEQNVFCNAQAELLIGDNADLRYYQLLETEEHVRHIGGVHAQLGRDAKLDNFNLAFGSLLTRVDLTVTYTGPGAHATVNGVYLPEGQQLVDYHTCIEHAVPHCTTDEVFRGIIADNARAVFNGRIHIHKDAQKTEAYLSNKNLLTSNKAEIDTKPELEIYADDVRCAHGATVSQLDDNSLHYLKTRGVSEAEALVMLSFGFINELLTELKIEAVADYCRPKLANRFARDPSLTRHIT